MKFEDFIDDTKERFTIDDMEFAYKKGQCEGIDMAIELVESMSLSTTRMGFLIKLRELRKQSCNGKEVNRNNLTKDITT